MHAAGGALVPVMNVTLMISACVCCGDSPLMCGTNLVLISSLIYVFLNEGYRRLNVRITLN